MIKLSSDRKRIRVWHKIYEYDFTGSLKSFIARINEELENVPLQYRDDVGISIGDDGDSYVEMTYERDETDKEYEKRLAKERELAQKQEAEERRQLARLKKKYGE